MKVSQKTVSMESKANAAFVGPKTQKTGPVVEWNDQRPEAIAQRQLKAELSNEVAQRQMKLYFFDKNEAIQSINLDASTFGMLFPGNGEMSDILDREGCFDNKITIMKNGNGKTFNITFFGTDKVRTFNEVPEKFVGKTILEYHKRVKQEPFKYVSLVKGDYLDDPSEGVGLKVFHNANNGYGIFLNNEDVYEAVERVGIDDYILKSTASSAVWDDFHRIPKGEKIKDEQKVSNQLWFISRGESIVCSGYKITKTFTKIDQNQFKVVIKKEPSAQSSIKGMKAEKAIGKSVEISFILYTDSNGVWTKAVKN